MSKKKAARIRRHRKAKLRAYDVAIRAHTARLDIYNIAVQGNAPAEVTLELYKNVVAADVRIASLYQNAFTQSRRKEMK